MVKHKHEWHLSKVQRFSNRPHQGYSEWACECGVVKQIKIFAFEVVNE